MHSIHFWLGLALLVVGGLCVSDGQIEMVQWEQQEGDGTAASDWTQIQTWGARIPDAGNPTYAQLNVYANELFNYVYAQPGQSATASCLVAAYYEPISDTIYASTIPKGGRKRVMQLTAARDAPVWFNQVRSMPLIHPQWHAEDGAYYTYEATTDDKPTGPKYNQGSMITAWGKRFATDVIKQQPLCNAGTSKSPTCQQVAAGLGVAQTQPAQQPPPPVPAPNPDPNSQEDADLMDDGLNDEEMTLLAGQICPAPANQKRSSIRARGLEKGLEKRACTSVDRQTSVPLETLPASDKTVTTPPTTSPPTTAPPGGQPWARIPLTPLSNCEWEASPEDDEPSGCGCDGYASKLPALSGANKCGYTAVPATIGPLTTVATGLNPTNPFPCTSTDMANGLVAAYAGEAPLSGYAGVQCTGALSPIRTLPPFPSSTVFVGNDSIDVGKTFGDPLYSGISSLLVKACPTGGSCDNSPDKWKIGDVTTYDSLDKSEGTNSGSIVVNIVDSSYTDETLPALIVRSASSVNLTAQGSVMCTTLDTCTEATVRGDDPCSHDDKFCRATDYVAVIIQSEGSGAGQIIAHMELELIFDANSDPFLKDICDAIVGLVEVGLQLLGPELEPADVAAAGEVGALCREGEAVAGDVQSIIAEATGITS